MSEETLYQLRINLSDDIAETARRGEPDAALSPLQEILTKHNARLQCQYDAFAGYVAEAENGNVADYPLYSWTRATIEDPVKKAKYTKSFTLYVDEQQIYAKDKADRLEADLKPMVGGAVITSLSKFDNNPKNNPQPPAKYRQ